MANTGKKVYRWLVEYDKQTMKPTGRRKLNNPKDADYVEPVKDLTMCPLAEVKWQGRQPVCNIVEVKPAVGNNPPRLMRNGTKHYQKRVKLIDDIEIQQEDNIEGQGDGPYIHDEFDGKLCECQVVDESFDYCVIKFENFEIQDEYSDGIAVYARAVGEQLSFYSQHIVGLSHSNAIFSKDNNQKIIEFTRDSTYEKHMFLIDYRIVKQLLNIYNFNIQFNCIWWGIEPPYQQQDVKATFYLYQGGAMKKTNDGFVNEQGKLLKQFDINIVVQGYNKGQWPCDYSKTTKVFDVGFYYNQQYLVIDK